MKKMSKNCILTIILITILLMLINNYLRLKLDNSRMNLYEMKQFDYKKLSNLGIEKANYAKRTNKQKNEEYKAANYKKYVIYECVDRRCGGWADRLKGIMNAYAWSLITKREFLINITQPCNFNNLLDSNEVKWNRNFKELIQNGVLRKNFTKYILSKIDDLNYRSNLRFIDVVNFEKEADIISIRTNLEWFGPLARNKLVHNRLIELGFVPNKFDMNLFFKAWFNKLFKLNQKLELAYENFLKKISNKNLICAQVRIGGKRPNVRYDKVFTKLENSKYYWNYINETFIRNSTKNGLEKKGYKIFITSDTESIDKEAMKIFGEEKIVNIKGVFTHIDREYDYGNDCSRYEKIILDFFILAECDMAIISFGNFGRFGILRRKNPHENLALFNGVDSYITKF